MCFSKLSLSEICEAKTKAEEGVEGRYDASYASGAKSPERINALLNLSQLYQTICIRNLEHFYEVKLPHHGDDTPQCEILYARAALESKTALDKLMPLIRLEIAIGEAGSATRERFNKQNNAYRCIRRAFNECVSNKTIKLSGGLPPSHMPLPGPRELA